MSKSSKSYSIEDQLSKIVDEMPGSNSEVVNEALRRYLITETEVLEHYIEKKEKQREQKRIEKQQIEQDIWELDDAIEDLKDMRSRAKAVEDTKEAIGMDRIEQVARIVKVNKYDSDGRSMTETEVIQQHTKMIKEEHPDLDKEEIRETLDVFVNV